jgi:hypothetical protein
MMRLLKLSEYIDGKIPIEKDLETRIFLGNEILSPRLSIATVKYLYFKNNGPFVLHFKRIKKESN